MIKQCNCQEKAPKPLCPIHAIKKIKPHTQKQKGFVRELGKTGDPVQAVLNTYDVKDKKSAEIIAKENLEKLAIGHILERHERLRDEALVGDIEAGLEATKRVETKNGSEFDPDWGNRHKYLTTTMLLKGHLNNQKEQTQNANVSYIQYIQQQNNAQLPAPDRETPQDSQ